MSASGPSGYFQVPFIKKPEANWQKLTVPAGMDYGINSNDNLSNRWNAAASYRHDSDSGDFLVAPVCNGTLHCDFRSRAVHTESNFEIAGMGTWLGKDIVDAVKSNNYQSLTNLPFPANDRQRQELFYAIADLGQGPSESSVAVVLTPFTVDQFDIGSDLGELRAFIYESIDIASLHEHLVKNCCSGTTPGGLSPAAMREHIFDLTHIRANIRNGADFTWDVVFKLFLLGLITARATVTGGTERFPLGRAGRNKGDSTERIVNLYALSDRGPVDPLLVLSAAKGYNKLAGDVEFLDAPESGGCTRVTFAWAGDNSLLSKKQDRFRLESGNLSFAREQFIETLSKLHRYPFSILCQVKTLCALNVEEWREVGNGQKGLHLERLQAIEASGEWTNYAGYFEWNDRFNVFQLEAVVTHFCFGTQSVNGPNDHRRDATPVDVEVDANFLMRVPMGWRGTVSRDSGVYLVQIDRISDLGGPKTGLRLKSLPDEPELYDEFEGCLFVVAGGEVADAVLGFTSFTGKSQKKFASSIEGNRRYLFRSNKSGGKVTHNYAFMLSRDSSLGEIAGLQAWYYWGSQINTNMKQPGEMDDDGKKGIVLHRGSAVVNGQGNSSPNTWNWSQGCHVAPPRAYYRFRRSLGNAFCATERFDEWVLHVVNSTQLESEATFQETNGWLEYVDLIEIGQAEALAFNELIAESTATTLLSTLGKRLALILANDAQQELKELEDRGNSAMEVARANKRVVLPDDWSMKIVGTYYLVRPLERTLLGPKRRLIVRSED
jgi:hypothetical protein